MELIFASLISGLIGALASAYLFLKYEKKKFRLDTAKKLFGNRYDLNGDEFSRAMNEVYFVFHHNEKVLRAVEKLFEALDVPGKPHVNDSITTLLKAICDDVGVNYKTLNESYMLKVFNQKQRV
ncbi:hypothetical protein [Pseudoalteromonas ruthenica]|uniref:hypothetical protein n=1 Tax=Pseudoalteromonas ruthenica TaxID=151081 RepID=UPI00110ABB0D|nr:hypothetical protein [Pseudoalteromonas ruthenica]TMO85493.1 hypothetical protein CWC12_16595 [Pseudoalteromonas ruthenica]TMP22797.1 hypothetical protein CWC06_13370 [Pseudoalteromonas ruthenica]